MREIKFRAWNVQGNEFANPNDLAINLNGKLVTESEWDGEIVEYENHPFVFEQFTGLHDKNGKEIYEGDIVCDKDGHIGEVEYISEHAAFVIREINPHRYNFINCGNQQFISTEIIGNIHENPELLEESK